MGAALLGGCVRLRMGRNVDGKTFALGALALLGAVGVLTLLVFLLFGR